MIGEMHAPVVVALRAKPVPDSLAMGHGKSVPFCGCAVWKPCRPVVPGRDIRAKGGVIHPDGKLLIGPAPAAYLLVVG